MGPGSESPYVYGWVCIIEYYVGFLCPSTTLRAAVSSSSLYVTPECDLTLPICDLYPMLSLVYMMFSARCKRCLWRMKLSESMAFLRMVLMLKALSVLKGCSRDYWLLV